MDKKKVLIVTIIAIVMLTLIIGGSYAYFTASVQGNATTKNISTTTGTLALKYSDNTGNINATNIEPGWSATKKVSVKNEGSLPVTYDLVWLSLENGIDFNELTYTITCTSGCNGLTSSSIPYGGKNIPIIKNQTIASGVTQTYTINFEFKEIGELQDYNQGVSFSGNIGVLESNTYNSSYTNLIQDFQFTLTNNVDGRVTKLFKLRAPIKPNTKYRLSAEIEAKDVKYNDHGYAYSRYGCELVIQNKNENDEVINSYFGTWKLLSKTDPTKNQNTAKDRYEKTFTTPNNEIISSYVYCETIVDGAGENVKVSNPILEEINE